MGYQHSSVAVLRTSASSHVAKVMGYKATNAAVEVFLRRVDIVWKTKTSKSANTVILTMLTGSLTGLAP